MRWKSKNYKEWVCSIRLKIPKGVDLLGSSGTLVHHFEKLHFCYLDIFPYLHLIVVSSRAINNAVLISYLDFIVATYIFHATYHNIHRIKNSISYSRKSTGQFCGNPRGRLEEEHPVSNTFSDACANLICAIILQM